MTIINGTHASIDTTSTELKLGETPVKADRRTTKEKPLSDAERIRRVILPAGHWTDYAGTMAGSTSQALTDLLTTALRGIADNRLRDFLEEQPGARQVALADYTVPALLAWNADTAASRGSITFTRDAVVEWYGTSKVAKAMTAKSLQHRDLVLQRLAALSAKNHGLKKPEDCDKLVALLAEDVSQENCPALVAELVARLEGIRTSMTSRKADAVLSLDDL